MKHSKLILGLISGAGIVSLCWLLDKKFRMSRNLEKAHSEAEDHEEHRKHHVKSVLRKTMDKASHIKQDHKSTLWDVVRGFSATIQHRCVTHLYGIPLFSFYWSDWLERNTQVDTCANVGNSFLYLALTKQTNVFEWVH